jgi:transposase
MPKQIKFELTNEQQDELRHAVKYDKRVEVQKRATALRLLVRGDKPAAVAKVMAVSEVSIYGWWHRYQKGGIEALAHRPRGRPETKADARYLQELASAIEQEPSTLGYTFAVWTVKRLRDHLARITGVTLSVAYLNTLLRQQGYVYRRPKHDLTHRQDLTAKVAAHHELEELKKGRVAVLTGFSLWTRPA